MKCSYSSFLLLLKYIYQVKVLIFKLMKIKKYFLQLSTKNRLSNLTAWKSKLCFNLVLQLKILLYRFPDSGRVNTLWLGWVLLFNILWALHRHPTPPPPTSLMLYKQVPMIFLVVLITCCRASQSWAVQDRKPMQSPWFTVSWESPLFTGLCENCKRKCDFSPLEVAESKQNMNNNKLKRSSWYYCPYVLLFFLTYFHCLTGCQNFAFSAELNYI